MAGSHIGQEILAIIRSIGAGARNPNSSTESYLVTANECKLDIVDTTNAVINSSAVANDTLLMQVTIPHNVTTAITATISGFQDTAGNAVNIVHTGNVTATDPVDIVYDFKGAINDKGQLTVTASVTDKVIVLSRKA